MSPNIGIEFRRVNNLIRRFVDNQANKKIVDRITGMNGWIIGYIDEHAGQDVFQRDLEREFRITRSTASKIINLMVQKGLIERHNVPEDARLKKLVLTPKANEVSALMREDARLIEQAMTRGFSEQELNVLYEYLVRMEKNLAERV